MRRLLLLTCSLSLSAWAADANALLDKAEAAMKDLEYSEALKHIEAARKENGNSRATMLRLYELQGVTLATLGQEPKALKAFQTLLTLTPEFRLSGKYPPKVTTVFFEARSWIETKKALAGRGGGSVITPGSVKEVKVEISNDPLKLAKEVRFHLIIDGKPKDVDVAVTSTTVSAPVNAPKVSWWAELLGEKDAALLAIGAADKPWNETAPDAPVAVVKPDQPKPTADQPKPTADLKPAPKPEPVAEAKPKLEPKPSNDSPGIDAWSEPPPPSKPMPGTRIAGIAVAGGGVACVGLGVVFGAMAGGTAAKINGAEKDSSGRIIGITRADALTLDAQQRTQATLANVFLISGAALAAGGATLIILSTRDTSVALVPQAGGLSVAGNF
ncbi:MAG: hypothetical protein QM817_36205 [Archangium sp.]